MKKTKGGEGTDDQLITKMSEWLHSLKDVEIHEDRFPSGTVWFDIYTQELRAKQEMVVVEARPTKGFGISTVKSDRVYGEGADVVIPSLKKAKAEIEKRLSPHGERDITTFS